MFKILLIIACLAAGGALAAEDKADYDRYGAEISKLELAGRYNEALSVVEQFIELSRKRSGSESVYYARAISWKAYIYLNVGRINEAAPLFEVALSIFEKKLKPDDPELARAINNLGIFYQAAGRLNEAETMLKRALEIREGGLSPDDPEIAASLNNLTRIYKAQDRPKDAELLLRRALEIRERALPANSPLIAGGLQSLAAVLELQGRDSEAEALIRRAITIRKRSQPPLHPEIAGALHHLAHNLYRQGRLEEAETYFQSSLRIREQSQAPGHPDIAENLKDLANLYITEKRFAEASTLLQNVIGMTEKTYSAKHPSLIEPLELMAVIADSSNQAQKALDYARRGTQIAIEREKLTRNNSMYLQDHVRLAWKVYEATQHKDVGLIEEALMVAQRAELTATAASISNLAVRLAATDPALREIIRERQDLESARETTDREFDALLAIPPSRRGELGHKLRASLDDIQSRLREIDARIKANFPEYAELVRPTPLSLDEIRRFLHPEEVLVNFLTGDMETFVWAITKEEAVWQRLDITSPEIEDYEKRLRNALQADQLSDLASKDQLYDLGVANDVYRRLFGPVENTVRGKRQLILVSSGVLTSMPFQALVLTPPLISRPSIKSFQAYREADWFIRRFALSVLPAVSSLKALRSEYKASKPRKPLIGFANPKYGEQKLSEAPTGTLTRGYTTYWKGAAVDPDALRAGLMPLPEFEQELRSVARSVGAADEDLKFGAEASETAVKQAKLENYRIIYFAAHGLVAGEISGVGEPALALALPAVPSELDDGLLTMSEVSKLRLDADWVVLSACDTAAGGKQGAEALSGLARAFFHAGARALLVSHWPVETQSAVQLTVGTFEALRQNPSIGRAEALRQSMLAFIADPAGLTNGYPAYWAPFFVVGEGAGR